jgi:hypothetical protein
MMQLLLLVVLFFNLATSSFLSRKLLQTAAGAGATDSANTVAAGFPATLFTPFNIEGAGAYIIKGYNGVRATYPYNFSVTDNDISSSSFTIDPAQKKLVFNQGVSGNEYVFENGTYITLNVSNDPSVPLLCTYLPYVNYDQEVAAIANLTLQDVYYTLETPQPSTSATSQTLSSYLKVNLFSGITVDASSCGTMIAFTIAAFGKGFIRGIYASEPFHSDNNTPTNVFVATSALIFDPTTLETYALGTVPHSKFQLPANCFPSGGGTPLNYCEATGFTIPLDPVCDLFPVPS